MYQVDEKDKNNEFSQYITDSKENIFYSKLNEFEKLDENNLELIIEDLNNFIHYYLFKGEISSLSHKIQNLFELEKKDFDTLKAVYFLLDDDVRKFINSLPILLRNLSHSTQKENQEFRGIIRGRIDWNSTIKTRYSKGFNDPSLFICTPPSKFYDLEENQLLKFMLKEIIYLIKENLSFLSINENIESYKGFNLETLSNEKDWYNIIQNDFLIIKKALKKVYFDEISDVKDPKPKMIRKAKKNRNHLYHRLADVYKLYYDLFVLKDDNALMNLLEGKLIKAADPDKLFEIFIFLILFERLPEENRKIGLMRKGKTQGRKKEEMYSACCKNDDGTILRIYYQYTPEPLKKVSKYKEIIKDYDIRGKIRAPDIILEFKKGDKSRYRLIEVKNTSDTGYVPDSIYKVMGYYHDFAEILNDSAHTFCDDCPVVLVTWGGISLEDKKPPFEKPIIVLNGEEFIDNLDELIG